MRRAPTHLDYPLDSHGSALFSAVDPVPLLVLGSAEEAEEVRMILNLGYACALAMITAPEKGGSVLDLDKFHEVFAGWGTPAPAVAEVDPDQPDLPLEENLGWSIDGRVNRS